MGGLGRTNPTTVAATRFEKTVAINGSEEESGGGTHNCNFILFFYFIILYIYIFCCGIIYGKCPLYRKFSPRLLQGRHVEWTLCEYFIRMDSTIVSIL